MTGRLDCRIDDELDRMERETEEEREYEADLIVTEVEAILKEGR